MVKIFNKKRIRKTAALLLTVWSLAFFHSELNQFTVHGDSHHTHDFCSLVDNTTSRPDIGRTSRVTNPFFNLLTIINPMPAILPLFEQFESTAGELIKPPSKISIYLFKNSFLI